MTVWPYFEVMNSDMRTAMAARERVIEVELLNQPIAPACPLMRHQVTSVAFGAPRKEVFTNCQS